MNKKKLSVVMAGAMLATSVAPVLAATDTVVNENERGLVIRRLRELLLSKSFSKVESNKEKMLDTVSGFTDEPGDSVYYVKIGNKLYDATRINELEKAIQDAAPLTTIEVYDRGFVEKDGKVYNYALETIKTNKIYSEKDLEDVANDFNNGKNPLKYSDAIYSMSYENGALTVKVRKAEDQSKHVTITLKAGDKALDFARPLDKNGELIVNEDGSDWKDFDHFDYDLAPNTVTKGENIPTKLIEKIKLTDMDASYDVVLSDLYDGLFLTANGQKLFDTLKEYDAEGYSVVISNIEDDSRGIYKLSIELTKAENKDEVKQVVNITTNDKDKLQLFANGIAVKGYTTHGHKPVRKFPVQKLIGEDRYATAVKIAKENANISTVALNGNIVLVNGNSLVDGLAAAPLAASVVNKVGNTQFDGFVAPILLTSANGLPKATKDYMKELVAHQMVGGLNKVTVYLVGGEAVISDAVVNELEEIGLRVVRAGGKDREETSLKVAKLMKDENGVDAKDAFVVGADGEADAMSVAAYAAQTKTPIIVESRKGISDNTVEYLRGYKNASGKDVTVVGGENVVSAETVSTLKAKDIKVDRLAGSNRKATNAKVIRTLYSNHGIHHIVVSPDGQADNNKSLIDALTATSIAASNKSPIVLATDKLSNDQLNALELKAKREGVYVYQIGGRVADAVTRTIASRINLAK